MQNVRCGPKTVLVNIDVAKFFLGGSHDKLFFAIRLARGLCGSYLKTCRGSCFHRNLTSRRTDCGPLARAPAWGLSVRPYLEMFGVVCYIRLFDDIFALVATRERALDFFELFQHLCKPSYVLELDAV